MARDLDAPWLVGVSTRPRAATPSEAAQLWPAVRAERIFDTSEQFAAYCERTPWAARTTDRGEASLLGVWRSHLDVLAMRGVFCSTRHVAAFVDDARDVARAQGLKRVLSPLLPVAMLGPYLKAGMVVSQRITAIQGHARAVLASDPPLGVILRSGTESDLPAVSALDELCFDEFWRYGAQEVAELFSAERLVVACDAHGQLIGYTLATESRGAVTLGRLGVAPHARGVGLGRALVSEVARWAVESSAETITLCTQEDNRPARRLYAACGLAEVRDAYGFAIGDAAEKGSA